jgi:hypothetical protein
MLTRSISKPRAARSVVTKIRASYFLNLLYVPILNQAKLSFCVENFLLQNNKAHRSSVVISACRTTEGNLDSTRILFNDAARRLSRTKMTTWLNSEEHLDVKISNVMMNRSMYLTENIHEIRQFPCLLVLFQVDVVLAKTVQGKFVGVDQNLLGLPKMTKRSQGKKRSTAHSPRKKRHTLGTMDRQENRAKWAPHSHFEPRLGKKRQRMTSSHQLVSPWLLP